KAKGDRAGDLVWNVLKPVLLYAAELTGDISDDIVSIDQAMKWGFGWEIGPFETWDAIGLPESVERMQKEGEEVPEWVLNLLKDGNQSFYKDEKNTVYYYRNGEYKALKVNPKEIHLRRLKKANGVIKKNTGASLIDLGDDVL